ncbi:MAG: hypothetical protein K0B84_03595 [Firmicutes bacterium]|nr:hypothetical protein [Bacillota bacterium]
MVDNEKDMPNSMEDEFAELDYRPKPKKGLILPLLLIVLILIIVIVGVNYLLNDSDETVADEIEIERPGEEQQEPSVDTEPEPDPEVEEEADEIEEEIVPAPSTPPDYDLLELNAHNWLIERTGDGEVIMLHTEELNDVERFFERFDLVEDNIIVYMIESKDDQFVTLLFGLPYSEWSTKAVFIWRDDGWEFLREESVI